MSRSTPAVHRAAAILRFLADHPKQAFGLTELVRSVKISKATCHSLLNSLVDVGYVSRTSDKAYVLGPSLPTISKTAAESGEG